MCETGKRVGNLTPCESVTGGAFDRVNCQRCGEFDQTFSKQSNVRGFARDGGGEGVWARLDLTDTFLMITQS